MMRGFYIFAFLILSCSHDSKKSETTINNERDNFSLEGEWESSGKLEKKSIHFEMKLQVKGRDFTLKSSFYNDEFLQRDETNVDQELLFVQTVSGHIDFVPGSEQGTDFLPIQMSIGSSKISVESLKETIELKKMEACNAAKLESHKNYTLPLSEKCFGFDILNRPAPSSIKVGENGNSFQFVQEPEWPKFNKIIKNDWDLKWIIP